MRKLLLGLLAIIATDSSSVSAHPGGLNSAGCHNNRRTGDYHCHRGGSSSGSGSGGGYIAPPQPVCSDEQSLQIGVKVFKGNLETRTESLWRSSSDVFISKGAARLNGESGDLYTYDVQGLRIKKFASQDSGVNFYSFDGSAWVRMLRQVKEGDTIISTLEPNSLGITTEHYTETIATRRVCR